MEIYYNRNHKCILANDFANFVQLPYSYILQIIRNYNKLIGLGPDYMPLTRKTIIAIRKGESVQIKKSFLFIHWRKNVVINEDTYLIMRDDLAPLKNYLTGELLNQPNPDIANVVNGINALYSVL